MSEMEVWQIKICLAMTGEVVADVEARPTDTVLDLRARLAERTSDRRPVSLLFQGTRLVGRTSLRDAGLATGAVLDLLRGGLPGWTRLCHGDQNAQETTGRPLVWDVSPEEVPGLAEKAQRVRIQQRGRPELAVESLAGSYPVQDLRKGRPIGFGTGRDRKEISGTWVTEKEGLVPERLWHTGFHWHRPDHDKLEVKVYHCCDNGSGIHWDSECCGWNCGSSEDLELFIDVELHESGSGLPQ
ncbi:unnamed protein product [Effrenium voratum]|nr:unnamed protein product [Effrenium voratum]